jgi:glutamate-ammonia-ligase adenylyltransferase
MIDRALTTEFGDEISNYIDERFRNNSFELLENFKFVCYLSTYVFDCLKIDPDLVEELLNSGDLARSFDKNSYASGFQQVELESLDLTLRKVRRREMIRIIFRDLTRQASLDETTSDLSNLADACLVAAHDIHYQNNCLKYGEPKGADSGVVQQMTILALGKLGARELNVSSDIDLIFFYDEPGYATSPKGKELSNQEFFIRTSRHLIKSLDETTADGFVFRVDMRLRPYGESGALILNSVAMEKYFYEQGRDWERYAFVKARPVAGNIAQGKEFISWLKPFIYRRHLDYGALESLREMKGLIDSQVANRQHYHDLKLGPGGIREIEFITQALQLIWGGRHPELQTPEINLNLKTLASLKFLPDGEVRHLLSAYEFLRNSEHVIQAENDRQTQLLSSEPGSRIRLAVAMGFSDFESYHAQLEIHRGLVREIFSELMTANSAEKQQQVEGNLFWFSLWRDPSSADSVTLLETVGFEDAQRCGKQLGSFLHKLQSRDLQALSETRVNRLMPVLLSLVAKESKPDITLDRLLPLIEAITRRSTYVSFLLENGDALKRCVHLCAMSDWISTRLCEFPVLLYELTDRQIHDVALEKVALEIALSKQLEEVEEHDLELQMDTLRQFKSSVVLRIAALELLDALPLMEASNALSHVAEVILARVVMLTFGQMTLKFGEPCAPEGKAFGLGFGIVAYGKLGGFELSYGSDLDLTFIHDVDLKGETNGPRQLENNVYINRFAQRFIHILTSYTQFGVLYEVDLRLRPGGNKGPLVSTLTAFERYQLEEAWTWEHQALVRTRYVAGAEGLRAPFQRIREEILLQKRNAADLRADVVSMRNKMRAHLTNARSDAFKADAESELEAVQLERMSGVSVSEFDLKHDVGAIVDIEFLIQYEMLKSANDHPTLVRWTDVIRQLDDFAELGIVSKQEKEVLQQAYLSYRAAVHYQWLGGQIGSFGKLNEYRQQVMKIWRDHLVS